jgi:hypothetical protein
MNPDELKGIINLFARIEVKFDDFACMLHQGIESFRMGVTTMEARKRSQVVALLIAFDHHCEFPFRLHRHFQENR